ncbi:MAG TPA: hypothetical protein VF334_11955 [Polyangia bacterium]
MEARRNPVNQAAVAFYLLAALVAAGVLFALAGAAVSRGVHINPWHLVDSGVLLLIGVLVQRRSLAALIIGTALFALICIAGAMHGAAAHMPALSWIFFAASRGALVFIMVRGIVALARRR